MFSLLWGGFSVGEDIGEGCPVHPCDSWEVLVERGDAVAPNLEPPRKAKALYAKALELVRDKKAGASAESLVLDRLGQAQAALGEEREAELSFLRSLRLRLGREGEEEATAETLDRLASLYYQMGQPEQGLSVHREALHLRRQRFGHESVEVAQSMALVASAHEIQRDYEQAEKLFRQAIDILRRKAVTKADRERLGVALINLGTLLKKTGRQAEGEAKIEEGLRLTE